MVFHRLKLQHSLTSMCPLFLMLGSLYPACWPSLPGFLPDLCRRVFISLLQVQRISPLYQHQLHLFWTPSLQAVSIPHRLQALPQHQGPSEQGLVTTVVGTGWGMACLLGRGGKVNPEALSGTGGSVHWKWCPECVSVWSCDWEHGYGAW